MDKETTERISAAPKEILVQVEQSHLDQFAGQKFSMLNNPLTVALAAIGWNDSSLSMLTAFIGRDGYLVAYKPETRTSAEVQNLMSGKFVKPFIARFVKEGTRG